MMVNSRAMGALVAVLVLIGMVCCPDILWAAESMDRPDWMGPAYLAAGFAVGLACIGSGYAVAKIGSAGMGAISEKPEMMGRVLVFVGLAEGIAIYGLIIAIMILNKL
ncbi:MAG: ATP synthase subunit C [Syntrophales bacterium]|nr:ATP synthase subunit C [Syntrophales bacterium]